MAISLRARPFDKKEDLEQLEMWRRTFPDSVLNLPHGFEANQVETVVVENASNDQKILSLTGFMAVVLNPLIRNPDAKALDILSALIRADTALSFSAAKIGALSAYITVPAEMVAYQRILQKYGYHVVNEDAVVLEKHLRKPVNKTLQQERDEFLAAEDAEKEPTVAEDPSLVVE